MERFSFFTKWDIFTKIDSSFTRSSPVGGTVSLFTYILIIILMIAEISNYINSDIVFNYSVDTEFDKKLNINVDMTIASPCSTIGADVMDSTNKYSMSTYGQLDEKDVDFELNSEQQRRWNQIKSFNSYVRQQHYNIHEFMWRPNALQKPIDNKEIFKVNYLQTNTVRPNACRLHGTITVNKVSGNFHVAGGKYLPIPIGHAHISLFGGEQVNFSHRIEKLSFGEDVPYVINTLDGVEKTTDSSAHLYQYYLKVVLTKVQTLTYTAEMYQYSVTERDFAVNHDSGAHGVPGIYFKYDIDALKVSIDEDTPPLWKFFIRICAIVGGILSISGFLNQLATFLMDTIISKLVNDIHIK